MISARTRAILFSTILLSWHSPLLAGSVSITGDAQGDRLALNVENANVAEILQKLGERFDFRVQGLQKANSGDKFSATLTGTLKTILERLLRNRNHMIEQSYDNQSAIVRVVILDSEHGSTTPAGGIGNKTVSRNARSIAALRREAAERRRAVQLRDGESTGSDSEQRP